MTVRALNLYYARRPEDGARVLSTRLTATDVRAAIGIERGRVFRAGTPGSDVPDVMWDCAFADSAAHDVDMRARAASEAFEACRAEMRTLTRRFERVLYGIEAGAAAAALAGPIVQCWISSAPAAGARADSPWPHLERSPIGTLCCALTRLDQNSGVPDWIVEAPLAARDELAAAIASWLAPHQPAAHSPAMLAWTRVG